MGLRPIDGWGLFRIHGVVRCQHPSSERMAGTCPVTPQRAAGLADAPALKNSGPRQWSRQALRQPDLAGTVVESRCQRGSSHYRSRCG